MKKNKMIIAVLGGVLSMGLVGASAATLGGLTGSGLGSDDQIVAACDTDGITVGYTTAYSAAAQVYQVTAVNGWRVPSGRGSWRGEVDVGGRDRSTFTAGGVCPAPVDVRIGDRLGRGDRPTPLSHVLARMRILDECRVVSAHERSVQC